MTIKNWLLPILILAALTVTAYSNFFHNSFQLDDYNAIVDNSFAQNPKNIPLFFKDAATYSTAPYNQVYRPLLTSIFSVTAWIGGLTPLPFHIVGLLAYILLGILLFFLFDGFFRKENRFAALFATLWFLLLPANTEAVNYINQNSEIFSLIAVIGSFLLYIRKPHWRKYYIYLLPFLAGGFIKISTVVFAPLLFAYALMIENKNFKESFKTALPSISTGLALAFFVLSMNSKTVVLSTIPTLNYLLSQLFVIPHYLFSFFFPVGFSADYGWLPAKNLYDFRVLAGFLVLAIVLFIAYKFYKNPKTKIAAFGIIWFFISLLPTSSIVPFSEILNDHRPFFAYVGLILAVSYLFFTKIDFEKNKKTIMVLLSLFLLVNGFLTYRANANWLNNETLWQNAIRINPMNERALMNYGVSQMNKGNFEAAKPYFEKVKKIDPGYVFNDINLALTDDALGDEAGAKTNFQEALALNTPYPDAPYYYSWWLYKSGSPAEAGKTLEGIINSSPSFLPAKYLLADVYLRSGQPEKSTIVAKNILATDPNNKIAAGYLAGPADPDALLYAEVKTLTAKYREPSWEDYLNLGLFYYRAKIFNAFLDASQKAAALNPGSAVALNNVGWAYEALGNHKAAESFFERALIADPNFNVAKNNLQFSRSQQTPQNQ